MMKYSLYLLVVLPLLSLSAPTPYWVYSIQNNATGSPTPREFQTLTNIPGTSLSILFSGVTYNGSTFNLPDTWILDTSVRAWKLVETDTAPPPRGYAVAVASKSFVFLFGGHNERVPMHFFYDVWRYDVVANKWSEDVFNAPSLYLSRSFHAGVLVGDTLYIFGGFVFALQKVGNDLWGYNTTSKEWILYSFEGRIGAPQARQGHSAVYYNDTRNGSSIIFFGGYNGTGGSSDTWQYIIGTNSWVQLTKNDDPMGPSPRWGHSAVLVYTPLPKIVIFGGSFVGGPINPYYNDVWELSLSNSTYIWTNVLPNGNEDGPWKRGGHSSVVSNMGLYVFGGYGMFVGLYNDVWQLINY